MRKTGVGQLQAENIIGWAHVPFSVGSKEQADQKTKQLLGAGYEAAGTHVLRVTATMRGSLKIQKETL